MTIACSARDARGSRLGSTRGAQCYTNWIEKKAQQILKNSKKDERRS